MTLVISNVRSTRGVFAYSVSCVFGQEYFLKEYSDTYGLQYLSRYGSCILVDPLSYGPACMP